LTDEQTAPDVQSPSTGVEAPASTAEPSLDDLLAEFKQTSSPPVATSDNGEPTDPAGRVAELRGQIDATRDLGELRQWALEVNAERLERRDAEDTAAVLERANDMVAEFGHLPADYAERWLRSEYMLPSGRNRGPEKATDYSRMSDSEARTAVEKEFGYTPSF
jgi:hypothetical protein